MTQTSTSTDFGTPLWLVPLLGLLAGAAHAAAWHFIPMPTVAGAISFAAILLLWIMISGTRGSRGSAIGVALLTGVFAIAASWALWLVLVFGLGGLRETLNFGGVSAVMEWVGLYLDQFDATVSRRSQSMSVDGDELRVLWMIMAGIWIIAPLGGALFRKT